MQSRVPVMSILGGSLLVLGGIVLALGIPAAGRILGAVILILIGIAILLGPAWRKIFRSSGVSVADSDRIHFSSGEWVLDNANPADRNFSLMFGSGSLDLTALKASKKPSSVRLDVLFGELTVSADDSIPVEIALDVFLAEAVLPDGKSVTGGQAVYRTRAAEKSRPIVKLSGRVTFGQVHIIAKTVIKKIGRND